MRIYNKLFIGGEWVAPTGNGVIEAISPHSEEVVGRVPTRRTPMWIGRWRRREPRSTTGRGRA